MVEFVVVVVDAIVTGTVVVVEAVVDGVVNAPLDIPETSPNELLDKAQFVT